MKKITFKKTALVCISALMVFVSGCNTTSSNNVEVDIPSNVTTTKSTTTIAEEIITETTTKETTTTVAEPTVAEPETTTTVAETTTAEPETTTTEPETIPAETVTEEVVESHTTTISEEEQSHNEWLDYYWNTYKDRIDCAEDKFKAECKELIDLGCDEAYACTVISEKYAKKTETTEIEQETSLSEEDIRTMIEEIASEKQDLDNDTDAKVVPYNKAEYDKEAKIEYTEYESLETMYTTCFTNVRRHPSIESDVVAQLNEGDSVEILGEVTVYNGEYCLYYKIQLEDGEGYINAFQMTVMNPNESQKMADKTAENLGAIDISEFFGTDTSEEFKLLGEYDFSNSAELATEEEFIYYVKVIMDLGYPQDLAEEVLTEYVFSSFKLKLTEICLDNIYRDAAKRGETLTRAQAYYILLTTEDTMLNVPGELAGRAFRREAVKDPNSPFYIDMSPEAVADREWINSLSREEYEEYLKESFKERWPNGTGINWN